MEAAESEAPFGLKPSLASCSNCTDQQGEKADFSRWNASEVLCWSAVEHFAALFRVVKAQEPEKASSAGMT
jgi:hypothetical protein